MDGLLIRIFNLSATVPRGRVVDPITTSAAFIDEADALSLVPSEVYSAAVIVTFATMVAASCPSATLARHRAG